MKFVHLTPRPNIGRIRKNGIRIGRGRRGPGVYALPLMWMNQLISTDSHGSLAAPPRSSITLWQWLAGLSRHRHMAAILFGDASSHWPATLYIELDATMGTSWLHDINPAHAWIAESDMAFVRRAHEQGCVADLKLSIAHANALGSVLHLLQSCGHTTLSRCDDSIELVFPNAVPARFIEKIIPLYRTNRVFRQAHFDNVGKIDAHQLHR